MKTRSELNAILIEHRGNGTLAMLVRPCVEGRVKQISTNNLINDPHIMGSINDNCTSDRRSVSEYYSVVLFTDFMVVLSNYNEDDNYILKIRS